MFTFIVFTSCLFYTLSSGQMTMNISNPMVGSVYAVTNNDSLLNFTFMYPINYQFDKLYVRFTIYDFIGNNPLNPQPYPFSWNNFTNSNFSLPWVVPPIILQSGDYIIGCFQWVQNTVDDQLVSDINQCVVTRTAVNSIILSTANLTTSTANATSTTATITAYFPAQLPYDQVNISANLNGTIFPSMMNETVSSPMTNLTVNSTYAKIDTFFFTNLTSNTVYNICVSFNYANSMINGTQMTNNQCQLITTLGDSPAGSSTNSPTGSSTSNTAGSSTSNTAGSSTSSPVGSSTNSPTGNSTNSPTGNSTNSPASNSTNSPAGNSTTTPAGSSSNRILSNLFAIILLFIFIFI